MINNIFNRGDLSLGVQLVNVFYLASLGKLVFLFYACRECERSKVNEEHRVLLKKFSFYFYFYTRVEYF